MAFALREVLDKGSQIKKKEEFDFKTIRLMKRRKRVSPKALTADYDNVGSFSVLLTARLCDSTRKHKALSKGLIPQVRKV